MDKNRLKNLRAFCRSQRQTDLLDAVLEHGSVLAAANAIGLHQSNVYKAIKRVERTAALQGFSPDHDLTKTIPDTHYLKGASTMYGADGKPKLQWVKSNVKMQDIMEDLRDFTESLAEHAGVFEPTGIKPEVTEKDSLTVYPLADVHFGMLAWSKECGDDYDLDIASRLIDAAAESLTAQSRPSSQAIVANLGDFFHFDNDNKQTRSGNILDVDGRWSKVINLGVQTLLKFIRMALEKHDTVKVINSIGNHDGQSALMLPLILKPYFRDEPRVQIDDTPSLHHYHKFGSNLLGFHHGHSCKPSKLPMVMVNDCLMNPKFESEGVEFCHYLSGHIHHETREYDGILVESFRTLAAKDAWHSGAGYRALRDIQSICYHRDFGEVGRVRISHKLLKAYL